jgi:pyruvate-formate lyase-activating enzyme
MPAMQVLLVQPPIYDFSAYDFWLRPYGMLRVAGRMRRAASLMLFDFLVSHRHDGWGRGRYPAEIVPKPSEFRDIPRHFRRFGRPRAEFRALLKEKRFDAVLVQTMMTYWYPGVREAIEDLRLLQPQAKIVLGGAYATICPAHASALGADLLVEGCDLDPLWRMLSISPGTDPPFWAPPLRDVGVIKLAEGCPFRCTYCATPVFASEFRSRPAEETFEELRHLVRLGARHVAFYDDALLFRAQEVLAPFLERSISEQMPVSFHTPNALNARFVTAELARLMVRSGFLTYFLGLESRSENWQRSTGGKVNPSEFAAAVEYLRSAGAVSITAYVLIGHPDSESQEIESAMHFAHEHHARVMLSEFSPLPGTVDGEKCGLWADLTEPLHHNKTAFTFRRLGSESLTRLKDLARKLNRQLN